MWVRGCNDVGAGKFVLNRVGLVSAKQAEARLRKLFQQGLSRVEQKITPDNDKYPWQAYRGEQSKD